MRELYYEQHSGTLGLVNGDYRCPLGTGFAGRAHGRNNPAAQGERGVGPLPRGYYRMGVVSHPRFHPPAIRLYPEAETDTLGRSGFWIHGGMQSEGCIMLERPLRKLVAALVELGFTKLRVVEG